MNTTIEIPATDDLTVYRPSSEVTDASRLWAAANLDGLGEEILFADRDVRMERTKAGEVFRYAYRITVSPGHTSVFRIHLFRGASSKDLEGAREVVRRAKAGCFNPDLWTRLEKWDNQNYGGWSMREWWHHSGEPERDELRPCHDGRCIEAWHPWTTRDEEYQEEPCIADKIVTDDYVITVSNWREGVGWEAYCDLDGWTLENAQDLRMLDRVRNDFAYLLGEAERLNAFDKANAEVPA